MNEGSDYLPWCYKFQEKAKKILDIWTKSTTFPPAVLTRLENVLKGDDAPGAYLVPILCSLSIPPFVQSQTVLSLYAFWKVREMANV
jgi:hypothetical protein